MKRLAFTLVILASVTVYPAAQSPVPRPSASTSSASATPLTAMLNTYCVSCHSTTAHDGGLVFADKSLDDIGKNAETWEKAVRKLRGRLMPPPGSRQPDQSEVDAFVSALETQLDNNSARPLAGHVAIQRMTRTEFGIAVKDLLGVEIDADSLLPAENEVGGFNNIAAPAL